MRARHLSGVMLALAALGACSRSTIGLDDSTLAAGGASSASSGSGATSTGSTGTSSGSTTTSGTTSGTSTGTGGFGGSSTSTTGSGTGGFGGNSTSSGTGGFGGNSTTSSGTGGFGGSSTTSSGTGGFGGSSTTSSGMSSSTSTSTSATSASSSGTTSSSSSTSSTSTSTSTSSTSTSTSTSSTSTSTSTSTSSTSTSTSTSTSSSSTSASSSTGGILESCTNGIDDDGDGLADCADPDCSALFTCAPPVPPGGWVGPLAIWTGPGTDTPPGCNESGGFLTEVANAGDMVSGAAPTCPSCTCDAPKGVACQVASSTFFPNPGCTPSGGTLTIPQGICQPFVTLAFDPASVRWATAPAAGGACLPKTVGPTVIPPLTWGSMLRACGDAPTAGAGCGLGACVPKPAPPFEEVLCIYQAGDLPCPAGAYATRQLLYMTATDTRSCSDCDCGNPTGTSCQGTLKLYTDTACTAEEVILTSVSQCASLPPDTTTPPPPYLSQRSITYAGSAAPGGSCPVITSKSSGSVGVDDPITVCCTP